MTRPEKGGAGISMAGGAGFVPQGGVSHPPPVFESFRLWFGFVPNLVLARSVLPRVIQAEAEIADAFLFRERALSRAQKELILLAVAAAHDNRYGMAMHSHVLTSLGYEKEQLDRVVFDYRRAGLSEIDVALVDLALRLGRHPTWTTKREIEDLRTLGVSDEEILEAVLATSWGGYLSVLASGFGVTPDFEVPEIPLGAVRGTVFQRPLPRKPAEPAGPYIRNAELKPESFQPFAFVKERWGFVPNLFQAQTLRPDLVEAELRAIHLWLMTGDILSQRQKEYIFLAISAVNLNTYCVVAHCEVLCGLGVSEEISERIALNYHQAGLSPSDEALLDVCLKLAREPLRFSDQDLGTLRRMAFSEQQIVEAITIAAISNFINTLNTGLGVEPDYEPKIPLGPQKPHPFPPDGDLTKEAATSDGTQGTQEGDPDAEYVAQVQGGDPDAFEELVRRHGRRVHRALAGLLRNNEDIEDAVQDTFVKAFQHIGEFRNRSRFSTWLTRIAINTGLQRLRRRKEFESLDSPEADEFRPRQVEAWQDDPEQSFSKSERQVLVWEALGQLPLKYRVVVMLRDLQQLSTSETADALGLAIPTVKIRLFRGRLMLREALSPHFVRTDTKRAHG